MRAYDLIKKKRDGGSLRQEEVEFLVKGITRGEIPDYQASAFLMAAFIMGMTGEETLWLTRAMMASGATIDLSDISRPKVDKHSTGGVGDKVSIVLAPLMAAMGVSMPMIAGRGLGHTGGTLDKLESIPGLRTDLSMEEFKANVRDIGFSIMGQTDELAPADRKLYALRDVTATVESIPLIASSIMSKKLAEGIEGIVLDVKCGPGAFMKDIESARELAGAMVGIGDSMGVKTVALITDMSQPLGRTVGNALEIKECISALRGKGSKDLMDLTYTLASWMLNIADSISEETSVRNLAKPTLKRYMLESMDFIDKGDAFKKFIEMVDAQHGDAEALFKLDMLPKAAVAREIKAGSDGYVFRLDAECVGRASMALGAGRRRAEDAIDPACGIVLNKKLGDQVSEGEPIALMHLNDEGLFKEAQEIFISGLEISDFEPAPRPVVLEAIKGTL